MPGLMPGQEGMHTFEVRAEHLATAWDNNLPVLATPIVLWWTELVAMWLMDPTLEPGQMTCLLYTSDAADE